MARSRGCTRSSSSSRFAWGWTLVAVGILNEDLTLHNVLAFRYDPAGAAATTSIKLAAAAAASLAVPGVGLPTEFSNVFSIALLAAELLSYCRHSLPADLVANTDRELGPYRVRGCPDVLRKAIHD